MLLVATTINALAVSILIFLIYYVLKRGRSETHLMFSFYALSKAFWATGVLLFPFAISVAQVLNFFDIYMIGLAFTGTFSLLFALSFLKTKVAKYKYYLLLIPTVYYFIHILRRVGILSSVIVSITPGSVGWAITFLPVVMIEFFVMIAFPEIIAAGILLLYVKKNMKSRLLRKKINYMTLGITLTWFLSFTAVNLMTPLGLTTSEAQINIYHFIAVVGVVLGLIVLTYGLVMKK